jgi:Leucine-rich repeat (LRR) protein
MHRGAEEFVWQGVHQDDCNCHICACDPRRLRFPNLRTLRIQGGTTVETDLSSLPSLTYLEVTLRHGRPLLRTLGGALRSLDLRFASGFGMSGGDGGAMDALGSLTGLTSLRMDARGVRTVAPLATLTGLRRLCLTECRKLEDATAALGALKALTELRLQGCDCLQDLTCLPHELRHLQLKGCGRLVDAGAVGAFTLLETLQVCMCDALTHLGALPASLRQLNLSGADVRLEPEALTALTALTALACPLGFTKGRLPASLRALRMGPHSELSRLSTLTGLTELAITSDDTMQEAMPWDALAGLTSLRLFGCILDMGSAGALRCLGRLRSLQLVCCHNLDGLTRHLSRSALTKLVNIYAYTTELHAPRDLAHLTALRHLDLRSCGVSGVPALAALTNLTALQLRCSEPEREIIRGAIGPQLQFEIIDDDEDGWDGWDAC